MTKTPEQLAEDWMTEEYGDTSNWVRMGKDMSIDAFIAGYQAAKPQWISVKDHMPENGQMVLIYEPGPGHWISSFDDFGWGFWENGETCNPTHWMPLPKPPKGEG